jgi:hypothetical protein
VHLHQNHPLQTNIISSTHQELDSIP